MSGADLGHLRTGSGLGQCLRVASVSLRCSAFGGGGKESNPREREVNSSKVQPSRLSGLTTRKQPQLS